MIRRGKGQFGIVNGELAALEVEQSTGAAEVVQQMPVDMEKVCIIADAGDDMLVPNFGQHGPAESFQALRFQGLPPLWPRIFTVVCRFGAA